jgi:hypothetical protein
MADYTSFIDSYAAWATERMGVYVEAYKKTTSKVAAGTYSAHDLTSDLTGAWLRMAEDMATLVRNAAGAARPPAAPAPAPAPQPGAKRSPTNKTGKKAPAKNAGKKASGR